MATAETAVSDGAFRRVVFLDTNVLHYIDLYLRRAQINDLFPFAGEAEAAYHHLNSLEDRALRKGFENGLDAAAYLLREDVRVEYSHISELELLVGRARGCALQRAAAEGTPDRMWTRLRDAEISERLDAADRTAIRSRVEDLAPTLAAAGIDAMKPKPEHIRDAIALAKDVSEAVYMSLPDSVIYAGALVAAADELLSADDYLTKTVNRIKSNSDGRSVHEQLKTRVAAVLSREPENVTLPNAKKIPGRES